MKSVEAEKTNTKNGPLSDIIVLDVSRILSGPFCTMLLGDMGASVIKLEHPEKGDPSRKWPPFVHGESTYFLSVNRNKKSVTLDFQKAQGKALLVKLVKEADVFVENFKVGSLKRHGLDFDSLHAVNPRLIYCSISGYGQTGPRRTEGGFDINIQGESGIMDVTGEADGQPTKVGVSITDIVAGMNAALGILLALLAREKTHRGQLVDIALLDSAISILTFQASSQLVAGLNPRRIGNYHPSLAPYESFAASDGYFTLGVGTEDMWDRFCMVLAQYGFERNERFNGIDDRVLYREELHTTLQEIFAKYSTAHWLSLFKKTNVPCGKVNSVNEALLSEQVASRDMVVGTLHQTLGLLKQVGIPIKLGGTPGSVRSAPPQLGEHNKQVYASMLRLSESEIKDLKNNRII